MLGRNHLISNTASIVLAHKAANTVVDITETDGGMRIPYGDVFYMVAPHIRSMYTAMLGYPSFSEFLASFGVLSMGRVIAAILLFYLGTLLPDIDSKDSMLGRFVHLPLEHRTWTHTLWFVILLTILVYYVPIMWWLWWGYVLHLFWDSFSKAGICWLYPISRYKTYPGGAKVKRGHNLKLYGTGDVSETVVTWVIVGLAVLAVIFL